MSTPKIKLQDGYTIPQLGLGTGGIPADETAAHIRQAVQEGFRHVDAARAYRNESEVGEGVRTCGLPREEIFVTSKLWCDFQGYDSTLSAFDDTLKGMGLDYLDLYLIHWPNPAMDRYVDTWRVIRHGILTPYPG